MISRVHDARVMDSWIRKRPDCKVYSSPHTVSTIFTANKTDTTVWFCKVTTEPLVFFLFSLNNVRCVWYLFTTCSDVWWMSHNMQRKEKLWNCRVCVCTMQTRMISQSTIEIKTIYGETISRFILWFPLLFFARNRMKFFFLFIHLDAVGPVCVVCHSLFAAVLYQLWRQTFAHINWFCYCCLCSCGTPYTQLFLMTFRQSDSVFYVALAFISILFSSSVGTFFPSVSLSISPSLCRCFCWCHHQRTSLFKNKKVELNYQ